MAVAMFFEILTSKAAASSNGLQPFSLYFSINKSTASWSENTSQTPSHAKTKNGQ
jgi:hypothetical protein